MCGAREACAEPARSLSDPRRIHRDLSERLDQGSRLVFERFGIEHSASGVALYLVPHGLVPEAVPHTSPRTRGNR